ncbi:MAG: metallophosphoesterase, partial [Kiritimatiellae bacterium]|nr:metallophosphoesterase [Kiritimatiellia bacterium]
MDDWMNGLLPETNVPCNADRRIGVTGNESVRNGISRRTFFGQAAMASAAAMSGYAITSSTDDKPRLKVGVISDIHLLLQKDGMHSDVYYEKSLRSFDAMKADAVLLCGDIADCGLVAELEYAAEIWYRVFPGDRRSDGGRIQQLFHLGDHDFGGFAHKYPWAKKCSKDPDAVNHALVNEDISEIWQRLFHEQWAPIQVKMVKGYTFVLAHHPRNMEKGVEIPGLSDALAAAHPDPDKPFFFSMHRPVYPTLPEWDENKLEDDPNHKVLKNYPNVLAFFGHSHRSSVDELNLWQREYTAIHVPSTSYCGTRSRRENSFSVGNKPNKDRPQQMQRLDCTSSNHALFLTVYSSRIVISRLDVRHDATTGTDWVIPLPTPDGSCSAQTRKSHSLTPVFPSGAAAKVTVGRGKDRAQKVRDEVVISFPPAHTNEGHPRAFDYEVVAQAKNFRLVRRVFSTHAYWTESKDVEDVR